MPHRRGTLLSLAAGSARFGGHARVFIGFHGCNGWRPQTRARPAGRGPRRDPSTAAWLAHRRAELPHARGRDRSDRRPARHARLLRGEDADRAAGAAGQGPANPVESVGPAKRTRVRRMARAWLADGRERGSRTTASSRAARRHRGPAGPRRYAAAARTPRECFLNLSKYRNRAELRPDSAPVGAPRVLATGRLRAPRHRAALRDCTRATSTSRSWGSRESTAWATRARTGSGCGVL